MIRIMTADESANRTITVDGKLSGEGVEPVEACCVRALSRGVTVRLHLRDVSTIDEFGQAMLRRLVSQGVDLTANGVSSAYIVSEIQSTVQRGRRG